MCKIIKGLAITMPVIGRISIGKRVEANGKMLPAKDDEFHVTSLVKGRDGQWVEHPLVNELERTSNSKLRAIPVRLVCNKPELNLRAEYSAFDPQTGRPVCAGDGEACRRRMPDGSVQQLPCPGADACDFARKARCKLYGRLAVQIEGQADELGVFQVRTTSFNSIRALTARMMYLHAITGGLLSGMPLTLKIRAKSTTQSRQTPIYFLDLEIREGVSLAEAAAEARATAARWAEGGLNRDAFEAAVAMGLSNGAFEEVTEGAEVVEEFFPTAESPSRAPVGDVDDWGEIHPPHKSPLDELAQSLASDAGMATAILKPMRMPLNS